MAEFYTDKFYTDKFKLFCSLIKITGISLQTNYYYNTEFFTSYY